MKHSDQVPGCLFQFRDTLADGAKGDDSWLPPELVHLGRKEMLADLDKLILDERMSRVWAAMRRRQASSIDILRFAATCHVAVVSWELDRKQTPVERLSVLSDIRNSAQKLTKLIAKSTEFSTYNVEKAMSDNDIALMLQCFDKASLDKGEFESVRSDMGWYIPSLKRVLIDVQAKADEYSKIRPKVRKPRSKNANVHYFVHRISEFFKRTIGQPLHEAVAVTTCVMLDRDDVDPDYVRKLVNK